MNIKIYEIYSEDYMRRLVVIRCSNSHQVRKEVKSFVHKFTALAQYSSGGPSSSSKKTLTSDKQQMTLE